MSCMEHTCVECGNMDFNNEPRSPSICAKCGGDMSHHWDEQQDYNRERADEVALWESEQERDEDEEEDEDEKV